MIDLNIESY